MLGIASVLTILACMPDPADRHPTPRQIAFFSSEIRSMGVLAVVVLIRNRLRAMRQRLITLPKRLTASNAALIQFAQLKGLASLSASTAHEVNSHRRPSSRAPTKGFAGWIALTPTCQKHAHAWRCIIGMTRGHRGKGRLRSRHVRLGEQADRRLHGNQRDHREDPSDTGDAQNARHVGGHARAADARAGGLLTRFVSAPRAQTAQQAQPRAPQNPLKSDTGTSPPHDFAWSWPWT